MSWLLPLIFSFYGAAESNPFANNPEILAGMNKAQKAACVWGIRTTIRRMTRASRAILSTQPQSFRSEVGDKFLHCAISCHLTNRCGSAISTAVGWVKEFIDQVAGTGNPEVADLQANYAGIDYAQNNMICNDSCLDYAESLRP